jgi:hypothetical protein
LTLFILFLLSKVNKYLDSKIMKQIKHCMICGLSFLPDRRVGDRQKVCSSLSCRLERRKRSQADWLSRNEGYFKGRYPNTRAWLEKHPDYQHNYRRLRRIIAAADIQDELTRLKSIPLSELNDIQDELKLCLKKHLSCYRDSYLDADVQDELRLFLSMLYAVMIYKTRLHLPLDSDILMMGKSERCIHEIRIADSA